ncbi:reverse transcriptase domain-containing protein [Tanacetum coccineum]|uniref:Reverse transcriptase domain-containing protein n=1 Tax=Tanacetum coccineum TaxID=301880 RepID=A0ABQ5HEX6_9ASTR
MRTRRSNYPNNSNVTIPRRRRRQVSNIVEPEIRTIVEIAERTMEEILRAPTEGYGEAIVLPKINADHFEIKTNLLQLVQANSFYDRESENPHAHINSFKRITSTLRFRNLGMLPTDVINLMMFPFFARGKPLKLVRERTTKFDLDLGGSRYQIWIVHNLTSTSGRTILEFTIPDTKGEMKAITTRSGVAYEGLDSVLSLSNEVLGTRNTKEEETTDKEQTNFQGSIAQIPPPVIPISIPEPDVPKTLPKTTPIPESDNYRRRLEKDHFPLPFMDQMLERLDENEFYCFLDVFLGYFQIQIDPQDQEKTTSLAVWNFRVPSHDMIEKTTEVFMDDFSVFGDSFDSCLSNLEKMLKQYEDTNLVLNLGRKCSLLCIEKGSKKKLTEAPILVVPDWNLLFELMCNASDFAIGAVLGQRKMKHFQPIHYASKTMTEAQIHYTTTGKRIDCTVCMR